MTIYILDILTYCFSLLQKNVDNLHFHWHWQYMSRNSHYLPIPVISNIWLLLFSGGGDCCVGSSLWCTDSRRAWAQESHGMWDLSSPTRDQTHVPCIGMGILNHWTTRVVHLFCRVVTLFCIFYIGNESVRLSIFSFVYQSIWICPVIFLLSYSSFLFNKNFLL